MGILFLIWTPVEDTDVIYALLLGAGIAAWGALWALPGRSAGWSLAIGGLAGLLVSPLTIALMSFKSGLHAHGFPDFSPSQAVQVLDQIPYWTAAGLLAGWVWMMVQRRRDAVE